MNILITGSHSDITRAIKTHRENLGDDVCTTSHQKELPSEKVIFFDLHDYQNAKTNKELLAWIEQTSLDGLILNAATETPSLAPFAEQSWPDLEAFLRANILGNLWLLQQVLPKMKSRGFGRIVFVSSLNAHIPISGYSVYATAKGALEATIRYVAAEYGAFNITANTLQLGVIKTARNKKFWRRDSIRKTMEAAISLGRLGEPVDVNGIVDALLSKDSFIQGAEIPVSGGFRLPVFPTP